MASLVNVVVLDHLVSTIAYQSPSKRPSNVSNEIVPVKHVIPSLATDASVPFEFLLEFYIRVARLVQIDAIEKLIHVRHLRMSRFDQF
jgi:hypothetical protein